MKAIPLSLSDGRRCAQGFFRPPPSKNDSAEPEPSSLTGIYVPVQSTTITSGQKLGIDSFQYPSTFDSFLCLRYLRPVFFNFCSPLSWRKGHDSSHPCFRRFGVPILPYFVVVAMRTFLDSGNYSAPGTCRRPASPFWSCIFPPAPHHYATIPRHPQSVPCTEASG